MRQREVPGQGIVVDRLEISADWSSTYTVVPVRLVGKKAHLVWAWAVSRWPRSCRFIFRFHWELLSIRSIKDDSVEVSIFSENIKTYTMLWVVPLSGESLVKLSSGKGFCYVRFSTLLRACRGLGMAQILAGWNAKPLSWKWVQVMTRIDWFV